MRNNTSLPLPFLRRRCRFLIPLPAGLGLTSFQPGQWYSLCFPYLPLCDKLGICFDLTNQCGKVFSAPSLLPEPASLRHDDACPSIPHLSSIAKEPELTQARYFLSILHTHASLPTSGGAYFMSIFFTSFGQTCLMSTCTCPSKVNVCHCGHFMPRSRVSHMTAPTSLLSCLHV